MKIGTGIVRRIDSLGRIVIPKEYRKILGVEERDCIEISINESNIILNKYENRCVFCGTIKPSINFNGKLICKKCKEKINEL